MMEYVRQLWREKIEQNKNIQTVSVKADELITSAERDKDEQVRRDKATQREGNERLNETGNYDKDYLKSQKDKQKHCDDKGDIKSKNRRPKMCKSVQMQRVVNVRVTVIGDILEV